MMTTYRLLICAAVLACQTSFSMGKLEQHAALGPDHYSLEGVTKVFCRGSLRILLDGNKVDSKMVASHEGVTVQISDDHGQSSLLLEGAHAGDASSYDVVFSGEAFLRDLSSLHLNDACSLEGVAAKVDNLSLLSNTEGPIQLRGTYGLRSIHQRKNNNINVYWVDASNLQVASHAGSMMLAGTAQHTEIEAFGSSQLSLGSLRSETIWLSGHDDAFTRLHGEGVRLVSYLDGSAQAESLGFPDLVSDISSEYGTLVYHMPGSVPSVAR